jgi:hypothetical protein
MYQAGLFDMPGMQLVDQQTRRKTVKEKLKEIITKIKEWRADDDQLIEASFDLLNEIEETLTELVAE